MTLFLDPQFRLLFGGLLGVLSASSGVVGLFRRLPGFQAKTTFVNELAQRVNSWWLMVAIFVVANLLGKAGTFVLFSLTSFLALREFITITPGNRFDHRCLAWSFFVILPLNYLFLGLGEFGIWSIFIPVYAFLFLPARNLLSGRTEDFLSRTARMQWALGICVYALSHAPALLTLGDRTCGVKLLFFLVIVCQANDVLQYIWGKSLGKRPVAPAVSPKKTIEGTIGGILSATLLGIALCGLTPFNWWQAGLMALAIGICGFFGDLTLSAIKRDLKVKDYGDLIPGHGGVLDRIDSLSFAAPVFFHLTRYFFT